ncbi:MAG TPA: hypothetical protein VMT08_16725, partial [Bradyrhizobium sp.]|nr:hypothetical protein [Bradyrhizobium sp.]
TLGSRTRRRIHSPISFQPPAAGVMSGLLPPKLVSNAADTLSDSNDAYFGFCPAKSQLYQGGGKTAAGGAAE